MSEPSPTLAPTAKVTERAVALRAFIQRVVDEEEWPIFVSDDATVFELSTRNEEELLQRIEAGYGKKLVPSDLRRPIWELLDHLASE